MTHDAGSTADLAEARPRWPEEDGRDMVAGTWATAVESVPVGLALLDGDGRVLRANACMSHLLGRPAHALVGIDFSALVVGNDREAWLRDRSEVVRHQRSIFDRERRFFRPDGMLLWLSVSMASIDADGRPMVPSARIVVSASDVSGRRCLQDAFDRGQAELRELVEARTAELRAAHLRLRLADRMAAVGTLGAGLGHDMNNVLLPVRAHVNALAAAAGDSNGAGEHLTAIRQSLAYLQQLADGLHFLSMDPEQDNRQSDTDLHEWWGEVGAIMAKAVPRGVQFECDLPPGLPRIAVAPHRLTQAILNLVVNAGEAIHPRVAIAPWDGRTEEREDADGGAGAPAAMSDAIPDAMPGTVRLWADTEPQPGSTDPEGDRAPALLRIGVTDDGAGMPPDVARRAGTLYYTTKHRGMGTGLGLALVRMVVDRAGGAMDIQSEPRVGTTVSLSLPVSDDGESAERQPAAAS